MPIAAHAKHATAAAQASDWPQLPPTKSPQTILVVDDRSINRDFLVSLLKHFGYIMCEAESAEQAWEMAVRGGLDLIITDVHMNGMDGYTLLEKLAVHPETANIPAIVYSAAYRNPDFERFVSSHQLYAVLNKPSAPEVIVEAVHAALGTAVTQPLPFNQNHRSTTLIEIMQDLAEAVEPASLMQTLCKSAVGLLNARSGFVYLLDRGEGQPAQMFSAIPSDMPELEPMDGPKLGTTLAQIISGHSIGHFRHIKPKDWGFPYSEKEVSCLLCIPIFTSARDYGCMCLVGKVGNDDFTENDERLAQTLTSHAAMLYENAVCFDEIQKLAAQLASEVEERKRAEEDLERMRKEQVRLRDEFLSHVSHELRSPVMAVQQFLEILREGTAGEINSQKREYIDIAHRNTEQLNTMISDLLEVTRIQVGKLRVDPNTMPVGEVLQEAVTSAQPAAGQRQIKLQLDLPSTLPLVIADRSRVRQIATNLVDNALKFTSEQGSVTVKARVDPAAPDFVRISVSDTGCGLAPEEMSKVFERHYQVSGRDCAARKGLGLGLCICKELVTLQGGQIEVQSQPNKGSEFSFTLPIFSIGNLLTPILGNNDGIQKLVVLTVEIATGRGTEDKDLLLAARETIERCVLPDLDVVLPGSYTTRQGRMFIIIAKTDQDGACVMAKRVEDQLKRNPRLADTSCGPVLWHSVVEIRIPGDGLSESSHLAIAVGRIDAELAAIIAQRN